MKNFINAIIIMIIALFSDKITNTTVQILSKNLFLCHKKTTNSFHTIAYI